MKKSILVFIFIIGMLSGFNSLFAQSSKVKVSGKIIDQTTQEPLPYVNVLLKKSSDSTFVTGSISDEAGLFILNEVPNGEFFLEASFIGYGVLKAPVFVGASSPFLNLGELFLQASTQDLNEVEVLGQADAIGSKMDKKTYDLSQNISQTGGSVLQAMQNLPGVAIQEGKVQIRGNDRISVLIDGKQTALTGFGNQSGLDNLPASAVEKIEIINNPSAKFDANGNGGIINIILNSTSVSRYS
jgi:hypothetical protein